MATLALGALGCGVERTGLGLGDAGGGCFRGADCDDGIPCTSDQCRDGVCANLPRDEMCAEGPGGVCRPGVGCEYLSCNPEICPENLRNPLTCEIGSCEDGTCVAVSTCTDGESCCGDGTCQACDDGNPCTDDSCEGGTCVNTPVPDRLCDDGDPCTSNDICDPSGVCGGVGCMPPTVCSEGVGCVGCNSPADCPQETGRWSSCEYGAARTPATCSGEQSRRVVESTCDASMCNTTERTETRGCSRPPGATTVRCDSTTSTAYGACSGFGSECGESGTQSRTVTEWFCREADCRSFDRMESRSCSRDTDGDSCGAGEETTRWSDCGGFDGFCDDSGSQSRDVTLFTCSSGSCDGSTTTETRDCTRDPSNDGAECRSPSDWSACDFGGDVCATSGTQERTVHACASEMCASSTESRSCTRASTDGDVCGSAMTGDWGSCSYTGDSDCTGSRTRVVTTPVCDGGSCSEATDVTETDSSDFCQAERDGFECQGTMVDDSAPCVKVDMADPCDTAGTRDIVTTSYMCMDGTCASSTVTTPEACTVGTDGDMCDDEDACTENDMCSDGTCTGTPVSGGMMGC
ncbi:MAG TPA: hypothetical protein RMH85_17485 [Polyangiaceae bacterium LLY-WYZ-15_(1-7)]|nr:hypothetical protein [Polyangiaceae bacterium LLY-WYZ-15_(1-7)]HJL10296.1 hypothetical protein [Polyangiaceae bacterium LLY-WYZ-15_(1-7)]HJL26445.1 hypothetical protein [Polyangiaceae bacterium LLY-WYZ-15_(1-7)]HJL32956.1 hypothetical protein [Polyangiaceae bacterium LLY-WYZ-15_(1-7)]HJL36261.1 hypothetical protein [Polyangiaceae bacterium LLY-WYZ-15_(1-7)]